jgi:hypothetical protein
VADHSKEVFAPDEAGAWLCDILEDLAWLKTVLFAPGEEGFLLLGDGEVLLFTAAITEVGRDEVARGEGDGHWGLEIEDWRFGIEDWRLEIED